jgi:hypothetical protein
VTSADLWFNWFWNYGFQKKMQGMYIGSGVAVITFNTTFNNISVISWLSVLLVEKTGVHRENHRSADVTAILKIHAEDLKNKIRPKIYF